MGQVKIAEPPIVYVDMDGVLAQFDLGVEKRLLEIDATIDLSDKSSHFYISERVHNDKIRDMIHEISDAQGFFLSLEPNEGFLDGWRRIEAAGFHPKVLSKPTLTNPWCKDEKLEWIKTYMGPQAAAEAIIDVDKYRHHGIALIDDIPKVLNHDQAIWQHIVFSQAYNAHVETDFRMTDWFDPNLEALLARCAERYSSLLPRPLL